MRVFTAGLAILGDPTVEDVKPGWPACAQRNRSWLSARGYNESCTRIQIADPVTEIPYRVGAPARRAFVAAGYTTLEELLAADEKDLLALHGVGPKAIRILHEEAQS